MKRLSFRPAQSVAFCLALVAGFLAQAPVTATADAPRPNPIKPSPSYGFPVMLCGEVAYMGAVQGAAPDQFELHSSTFHVRLAWHDAGVPRSLEPVKSIGRTRPRYVSACAHGYLLPERRDGFTLPVFDVERIDAAIAGSGFSVSNQ